MPIEIARLKPSEYDLLEGIDDGFVPNPDDSIAMVGKTPSKKIISRLFAVRPWHVEGIFIENAWRGGSLFKDMMSAMEIECRAEGLTKIFAYSVRPEIGHYIEHRCGYKPLAWKVYEKEFPCRQP